MLSTVLANPVVTFFAATISLSVGLLVGLWISVTWTDRRRRKDDGAVDLIAVFIGVVSVALLLAFTVSVEVTR